MTQVYLPETYDSPYQGRRATTLMCMTTQVRVRNDLPVKTETPWERLWRLSEARRKALHLTQAGIQAADGPSVSWMSKLRHKDEEPGPRHAASLEQLDAALRWPAGTSLRVVTENFSTWDPDNLEDFEQDLVNGADEIGHFAFMVEQRLRTVNPDEVQALMRKVAKALGLPVVGD